MEIKTYKCDVFECGRQLANRSGSHVRAEIRTPEGMTCGAYFSADLCDLHLRELTDFFTKKGITLEPDI